MSNEESRTPVPERPLLHGARVWLRPLEARDMPAYVAGINDTEVGGRAGYRMPMSLEQATPLVPRQRAAHRQRPDVDPARGTAERGRGERLADSGFAQECRDLRR
jgi:hypothetical protein